MTILILYGTQTGNSKYYARITKSILENEPNPFVSKAQRQKSKLKCIIMEMDSFNLNKIQEIGYIIFICSTHGNGTEPFNAKNFFSFILLDELPTTLLQNLSFTIFGLGDSSFEKFNYCAKRLLFKLKHLGANHIIDSRFGDLQDPSGYFTEYRLWINDLYRYFTTNRINECQANIEEYMNKRDLYQCQIVDKNKLTTDGFDKEIYRIDVTIDDYEAYNPGDCIGIKPTNYNYQEFIDYNDLSKYPNTAIKTTSPIEKKDNVKFTSILNDVEVKYDFNCIPNPMIFYYLHEFIKDNPFYYFNANLKLDHVLERLKLIYEDYDFYYDYVVKPRRTFFEVLQDFSIRINVDFLAKYIPDIMIRYFTMCNVNNIYTFNVSIVCYKTILKTPRKGLCSQYIKKISIKEKLPVCIGKGSLFTGANKYIFLSTGTGITIPWSIINFYSGKEFIIFYGHRYKFADRLYPELKSNTIVNGNKIVVYEAISREGNKTYVQELFKNYDLDLNEDFLILVTGNSGVNKDLTKILKAKYKKYIPFQTETW